jgi:hypothetical protein
MLLRKDYIDNKLERISRNIAYIQQILEAEGEGNEGLLQNLTRLQAEYTALLGSSMELANNQHRPVQKKQGSHSRKNKHNKRGEQLSLF